MKDEHGKQVKCGARRQRDGEPCQAPAMANGRCRIHGGKSLKGEAHPAWKGVRPTKYAHLLPEDAQRIYEHVAAVDEWASLREDMDILAARLGVLFKQMKDAEAEPPSQLWARALRSFNSLQRGVAAKDNVAILRAQAELRDVLEAGASQSQAWDEVRKVMMDRVKIVESERKRQVEMREVATKEQLGALFYVVAEIVRDLVPVENKPRAATLLKRIMPGGAAQSALEAGD